MFLIASLVVYIAISLTVVFVAILSYQHSDKDQDHDAVVTAHKFRRLYYRVFR